MGQSWEDLPKAAPTNWEALPKATGWDALPKVDFSKEVVIPRTSEATPIRDFFFGRTEPSDATRVKRIKDLKAPSKFLGIFDTPKYLQDVKDTELKRLEAGGSPRVNVLGQGEKPLIPPFNSQDGKNSYLGDSLPGKIGAFGIDMLRETTSTPSGVFGSMGWKKPIIGFKQYLQRDDEIQQLIKREPPERVKKLILALREAKPLRGRQERIYTQEKHKRIEEFKNTEGGGEQGAYEKLGAFSGEYPKVQYEGIRDRIEQGDIDFLFDDIINSKVLGDFDKLGAIKGLAKVFGEYGGKVPQNSELKLLGRQFGDDLMKELQTKQGFIERAKLVAMEAANVPRSIMASIDFSAPLRQGRGLADRKAYWTAFDDMFKAWGSEKGYKAVEAAVEATPHHELAKKSGLFLSDLGMIHNREEQFISNYAEKIPVLGRGIRASSRAYTAFLNKVRMDVFNDIATKMEKGGVNFDADSQAARELADMVNNFSGRGKLPGNLEESAVGLNSLLFSPRLMASRLNTLNPYNYIKSQNATVRKEALRSLLALAGSTASIGGLAKLAGAEVELNPTSSDFGKMKVGNTRIDLGGGYLQYITFLAREITGKSKTTSGGERTLGEGYGARTRWDVAVDFGKNKFAPIPSFAATMLEGKDIAGNPVDVPQEVMDRFTPLIMQDMRDLIKEDPSLLPVGFPLAAFGAGVQTFDAKQKRGPLSVNLGSPSSLKVNLKP